MVNDVRLWICIRGIALPLIGVIGVLRRYLGLAGPRWMGLAITVPESFLFFWYWALFDQRFACHITGIFFYLWRDCTTLRGFVS
jgi:hypothetical protein